MSSWYGPGYEGRPTANGERFDVTKMTAAHRTMRFGTILDVTDTSTGRTVRVRVNDRGPFAKRPDGTYSRIIDLSQGAADTLGIRTRGLAEVELRVVG